MRHHQLTLWPRETLRHRIISRLLRHANSRPPVSRYEFYRMKDEILTSLAEPCGIDWQDVSRICYSCEGTGGLYEPGGCYKCEGSGVYRHVYVPLHRWRIGGRVFHIPAMSQSWKPEAEITVRGRIQHTPSRWAWSAALLLAFRFDRSYARTLLKSAPPIRGVRRRWTAFVCWLTRRCEQCDCWIGPFRGHQSQCSLFWCDQCVRELPEEIPF